MPYAYSILSYKAIFQTFGVQVIPALLTMHYKDTLYGSLELPAAVTDLLHTVPIQRLRGIHQDDAHLLRRLHALSGRPVADQYAAWILAQPPGPPIAMKPRRVDPKILLSKQVIRLSEL